MNNEKVADLKDAGGKQENSAAKQKKRTITIPVDDDLYEKISKAALAEDRTIPVTVMRAVRTHFNK